MHSIIYGKIILEKFQYVFYPNKRSKSIKKSESIIYKFISSYFELELCFIFDAFNRNSHILNIAIILDQI